MKKKLRLISDLMCTLAFFAFVLAVIAHDVGWLVANPVVVIIAMAILTVAIVFMGMHDDRA